jgi:hypothetical protein
LTPTKERHENNPFYISLKPIEKLKDSGMIPVTITCQQELSLKLNANREPYHQETLRSEVMEFKRLYE